MQFTAPLTLTAGSVKDLSGRVGLLDNKNKIKDMNQPWSLVYTIGDRLCHQLSSRSFYINGNQMPFCARCTAFWLGLAIGLGYMVFFIIRVNERFLVMIIIGVAPLAVDGLGQFLGLWESTNIIRFITGVLAGLICGLAIGLIIEELRYTPTRK